MDILQAIIIAVVEGVTEFLPISSTGHMIMAAHLMHVPQTEFVKTFEIAIQLGAILAVVGMYWRVFLLDWEVGLKVLTAFIPTAVIGFVLYKVVKQFLIGDMMVVVWSLFLGGAAIILFELYFKQKEDAVSKLEKISYPQAFLIGVFQSLAVVPGVSRSAATILGGMGLGVARKTMVEFSFLLAVPTMAAATALDLIKTEAELNSYQGALLGIGFLVAMLTAYTAVTLLIRYVQRNNLIIFGVYRVLVAVVFLWWMS